MLTVAVVVPYRSDGGGPRDRNWGALAARWRANFPGWELCAGVHADGPWCKAEAAAVALEGCTADVLVVADADVWCEPAQALLDAVTLVRTGRRQWVVPHRNVARLSEAGTARWLAGERDGLDLDQAPYRGVAGGGLLVVARSSWELLGGFDPRFRGWGGEDRALGMAADVLLGRHHRLRGTLWHLWHPPQPRLTRAVGSREGQRLLAEYRHAGRDRARMAELVERREV
ncbi:hypothetical protein BBK14_11230 [Parafrankia soli]|uniref:Galactosyltransferase C-terminal domain-containing protein n=1 Tax=Parafrankia soli TaxID=2599596 RepID=A0A1S1R8J7_9ACTN|nr:hypothetical protein BBK14_11230 [Parafrankia soli]